MADIEQAARWMLEGKTVSSMSTGRHAMYARPEDQEVFYRRSGARVHLHIYDLVADDWEIAE